MTGTENPRALAEHHANQAERLLKSWWLSSHVKGQLHATLAVYYSTQDSKEREQSPSLSG
jgi:hypothetical protein